MIQKEFQLLLLLRQYLSFVNLEVGILYMMRWLSF
jgi:hypothetical protein